MSVKSILFATDDVRAILGGRKTMFRIVIKPQPKDSDSFVDISDDMSIIFVDRNGEERDKSVDGLYATFESEGLPQFPVFKSKYEVDDVLWVKETWFREPCEPDCSGRTDENECPFMRVGESCYGFKAQYTTGEGDLKIKWRSSTQMPKEACRLFLRVTDVRVERLQEITYDDCLKEGMWNFGTDVDTLGAYQEMWGKRHAKDGFSWETNCWVWVYTFERCDKPEGWC